MKNMKKTITVVMMALMLASNLNLNAQIFIYDDEFEGTLRCESDEYGLIIGFEGGDADMYLPLGDGFLLLAGLGGAYLLTKRRKKQEQ